MRTAVAKKNWPTPAQRDYKDCGTIHTPIRKDGRNRMDTLGRVAAHGGSLSPAWVEWLMGWCVGFTSLEPLPDGAMAEWKRKTLDGTWWAVDPADGEVPMTSPTPGAMQRGGGAVDGSGREHDISRLKSKSVGKGVEWGMNIQTFVKLRPSPGPVPRTATGVKNRVARLKALGNGQVPLCAATAMEILDG